MRSANCMPPKRAPDSASLYRNATIACSAPRGKAREAVKVDCRLDQMVMLIPASFRQGFDSLPAGPRDAPHKILQACEMDLCFTR